MAFRGREVGRSQGSSEPHPAVHIQLLYRVTRRKLEDRICQSLCFCFCSPRDRGPTLKAVGSKPRRPIFVLVRRFLLGINLY